MNDRKLAMAAMVPMDSVVTEKTQKVPAGMAAHSADLKGGGINADAVEEEKRVVIK